MGFRATCAYLAMKQAPIVQVCSWEKYRVLCGSNFVLLCITAGLTGLHMSDSNGVALPV